MSKASRKKKRTARTRKLGVEERLAAMGSVAQWDYRRLRRLGWSVRSALAEAEATQKAGDAYR